MVDQTFVRSCVSRLFRELETGVGEYLGPFVPPTPPSERWPVTRGRMSVVTASVWNRHSNPVSANRHPETHAGYERDVGGTTGPRPGGVRTKSIGGDLLSSSGRRRREILSPLLRRPLWGRGGGYREFRRREVLPGCEWLVDQTGVSGPLRRLLETSRD